MDKFNNINQTAENDEKNEHNIKAIEVTEFDEDRLINELLEEENKNVISNNASTNNISNSKQLNTNEKSAKFPLSRIKSIMKMDPDVGHVSQESAFLVARATEMFLKQLSKESYQNMLKSKNRKTLQRKDLDLAIESIDALCFLEGALD